MARSMNEFVAVAWRLNTQLEWVPIAAVFETEMVIMSGCLRFVVDTRGRTALEPRIKLHLKKFDSMGQSRFFKIKCDTVTA